MLQETIQTYWNQSSRNYDHIIGDELNSFRPQAWLDLIAQSAPKKGPLDVLDTGCGPGFFSVILSKEGHRVTGIDCAPEMLEKAERNAKRKKVSPRFLQMDCAAMTFPDNSFDLAISRNLTWVLPDPAAVYREWQRVLRPGGVLLIFDANWHLGFYDRELAAEIAAREKRCLEQYGSTYNDPNGPPRVQINYAELPLSSQKRPAWDTAALREAGFSSVDCKEDVTGSLWDEKEKLLFGATPLFMIRAVK